MGWRKKKNVQELPPCLGLCFLGGGKNSGPLCTTAIPVFKKNIWPCSTSSHIFFLTQIRKLNFDSCCWFDVFCYLHLFHTAKCPYGFHLYVGGIQIKTFSFLALEKWKKGKNPFFRLCDLNDTVCLYVKEYAYSERPWSFWDKK